MKLNPLLMKWPARFGILFSLGILLPGNLSGQIKAIKPYQNVRALIVGVSEYQSQKIPQLEFAHRDAEAFAHYLQSETAQNIPAENITLLTNKTATYGNFTHALESIVESSRQNDRLIIYFSGHGDVEKIEEELTGYLLFYDAPPTTYAAGGACRVTTINENIKKLVLEKGVEVVLISDACRSGTLAGSSVNGPGATSAALAQSFEKTTRILSCGVKETSLEGPQWGGGRGLFSYFLVKGLKGMANRNDDGYVDLFELRRFVEDSVRQASKQKQLPILNGPNETKLAKVDKETMDLMQPSEEILESHGAELSAILEDTSFLPQVRLFETAIFQKHLMYPEKGSANQIYEDLATIPAAQSVRSLMKRTLAAALQDEAQQAVNEYVVSPAKELKRRWENDPDYEKYPNYLDRAAELTGTQSYFFSDLKSKAHYFHGLNLRMRADVEEDDPKLLQEAMAEQEKALKLQMFAPHVYNEMGLIHSRLQQYPQAITAFQQALGYSPKWSLALTNLALVYRKIEQYPMAEKIYKDAILLDSTFALSHYNLAKLYEQWDRPDQAGLEYRKAIQFEPDFADAYFNLASMILSEAEALSLILKYIQLKPEDPAGFNLLGYHYMLDGAYPNALQAYQSSYQLQPGAYNTLVYLSYIHKQMENFGAAEQLWVQYLQKHPDSAVAYLKLTGVLALAGNASGALDALQKALEKGYKDLKEIQGDQDLDSLRDLPAYQALISQYFPGK